MDWQTVKRKWRRWRIKRMAQRIDLEIRYERVRLLLVTGAVRR